MQRSIREYCEAMRLERVRRQAYGKLRADKEWHKKTELASVNGTDSYFAHCIIF